MFTIRRKGFLQEQRLLAQKEKKGVIPNENESVTGSFRDNFALQLDVKILFSL